MTELLARNITVSADGVTLVDDASLSLRPGELVAILGPNGAGKTSLLLGILGQMKTTTGTVELGGDNCFKLTPVERAKRISYLPQRRPLAWPNRVRDVVALGRFAHGATLGRLAPDDAEAVNGAIDACDLGELADRNTDSLSGGELARVHFARAIAAQAPLLMADEPVAALDPRHQFRIAELIRQFVTDGGGALVVLHEVALAARFADRLVWMRGGRIVAEGPPKETLDSRIMADVYGVRADVRKGEDGIDVRIEGAL